jgi:hypothetical protein
MGSQDVHRDKVKCLLCRKTVSEDAATRFGFEGEYICDGCPWPDFGHQRNILDGGY